MFRVCAVTVKHTAGIKFVCIHFFPIPKKSAFISNLGA
jgi:hypothetical protein